MSLSCMDTERIKTLELELQRIAEGVRFAISELKEWNPDSEAAKELESLLDGISDDKSTMLSGEEK